MKLFGPLYDRVLIWSTHRLAPAYLGFLSFIEAIFFPVPPEVMLAPMCLAKPKRGFAYAGISLVLSMLGALIGYYLGSHLFDAAKPLLERLHMLDKIEGGVNTIRSLSNWQVFWFLVAAGFTPIPLMVFTWASGIVGVPLVPFLLGMVIGRGKRVFLVALAIFLGGARAEAALRRWIEPIGWAVMALLIGAVLYFAFRTFAG